MSKMQEKKDSMQNSDLKHLRILIIQMLKGMILLAACLLLCWILFYKITAAPAIASAAIIGFFIYAIRVWLRWRKAPTNLTSAAASNPDHQSTPQDTKKELREELPKKIIYRAHWAFFVNLAYRPVLIFLVFLFS
jgi:flagellar basal body-associated protein FliL